MDLTSPSDGTVVPPPGDLVALRARIVALEDRLADADIEHMRQSGLIVRLRADIERIGSALMDEAVRRGWCADYETFVDQVNERLTESALPSRRKDFLVRQSYTVELISTVSALNLDDAESIASRQYNQIRESLFFVVPSEADQNSDWPVVGIDWSDHEIRVFEDGG